MRYKKYIKPKKFSKTKFIIEQLEEQCKEKDCRLFKCENCPLVKKSIRLFGIDVITIDKKVI